MKKLSLEGFLGLYRLWSKTFLLKFYFEQVTSHISVDAHLHNFRLASCGHFSTSQWTLGVSSLHGLALARINCRNASCCWPLFSFFLPQGWLYSLCPVMPTTLNVFNVDLLILITQPYLLPWLGKQGALSSHSLPCFLLTPSDNRPNFLYESRRLSSNRKYQTVRY